MSEAKTPELGEPSAELKQEFWDFVESKVPSDQISTELTLEDGRKLRFVKFDKDEHDKERVIVFEEVIPSPDGNQSVQKTNYYVFEENGERKTMKIVEVETPYSPDKQAEMDQILARRRTDIQELEAMGMSHDEASTHIFARESVDVDKLHVFSDGSHSNPLLNLLEDAEASAAEDDMGMHDVTGSELQSVLDLAREASETQGT